MKRSSEEDKWMMSAAFYSLATAAVLGSLSAACRYGFGIQGKTIEGGGTQMTFTEIFGIGAILALIVMSIFLYHRFAPADDPWGPQRQDSDGKSG